MSTFGKVALLMAPALLFIVVAITLSHYFRPPLPGGASLETLLPEHDCVCWNYQQYNPPSHVAKVDLKTGWVSLVELSRIAVMLNNSRGQRIQTGYGVEVFDADSGKSLWRDASLTNYNYLVGQRYLIQQHRSHLTLQDMLPVFENPKPDVKLGSPLELEVPGLASNLNWYEPVVQPIEGTNNFLCISVAGPRIVSVYEIDAEEVRLVASWPFDGGPVIQHAGKVWSSSPQKREVEVRSLSDCQIVNRLPLPVEMNTWSNIVHRHELISFASAKTGRDVVCRLSDFQPIPELNLPLRIEVTEQSAEDKHYYLFADGIGFTTNRMVVYDSNVPSIIYDAAPPPGLVEVGIDDGHLVLVTEALGLTVDMIDLSTGKLAKRIRPFGWCLLAITVLSLMVLVWLVVWSYCSVKWHLPPALNIPLVTGLMCTPLLVRVLAVSYWNYPDRPAIDFLKAILFALCFLFALHGAFGRARILLRLSVVGLWLAALLAIVRSFGWIEEQQRDSRFHSVDGVMRVMLVFTISATVLLFGLRLTSLKRHFVTKAEPVAATVPAASIAMWDLFAFMGSVALFITAAQPYHQTAWREEHTAFFISACIMIPSLFGLLGLARNPHLFRVAVMIQMTIGCVVILGSTLRIASGCYSRSILYSLSGEAIGLLCVMLATFTYCSLLRTRRTAT